MEQLLAITRSDDLHPQSTTPVSSASILQDAGEKIGGARKDLWAVDGMTLEDLGTLSGTEAAAWVTKKNIWQPNYVDMMAAGVELEAVALTKVLYDKLAAAPKENTTEGRRSYLMMMRAIRDVLSAARTTADLCAAEERIAGRVGASEAMRKSQSREERMAGLQIFFSAFRGRCSTLGVNYDTKRSARRLISEGFPNIEPWRGRLRIRCAGGPGLKPAEIRYLLNDASEVGTPLALEHINAGVFGVLAKGKHQVLGYAPTEPDAVALARKLYQNLRSLRGEGLEPVRPYLTDIIRQGVATSRPGNIDGEAFIADLGFRGIEFGNWAAGDERQQLINFAYDALMDLAEILGVPPKALSLNGTLGLALGARGGGRFAAHYEPCKRVINMTKIRGAGTLAHEWAHGWDHYCGELDRADAYATSTRGASGWHDWHFPKNDHLRPELQAAWLRVMNALARRPRTQLEYLEDVERKLMSRENALTGAIESMRSAEQRAPELRSAPYERRVKRWIAAEAPKISGMRQALEQAKSEPEVPGSYGSVRTAYIEQALRLCGKSGMKGYWARPTELWARAFEAFVFDRLQERGAQSQYLVQGVEAGRFVDAKYKGNPYPAEDRQAINIAIQSLIDVIRLREGHGGLPALW